MSCGVGHRSGSDLVLLWRRLAATALTGPLAWEPPYAAEAALEKAKKKKKVCADVLSQAGHETPNPLATPFLPEGTTSWK